MKGLMTTGLDMMERTKMNIRKEDHLKSFNQYYYHVYPTCTVVGCLALICVFVDEILNYENFDLQSLVTPVNMDKLEKMLKDSNYDCKKTEFLIDCFRNGFSIGYEGDMKNKKPSSGK